MTIGINKEEIELTAKTQLCKPQLVVAGDKGGPVALGCACLVGCLVKQIVLPSVGLGRAAALHAYETERIWSAWQLAAPATLEIPLFSALPSRSPSPLAGGQQAGRMAHPCLLRATHCKSGPQEKKPAFCKRGLQVPRQPLRTPHEEGERHIEASGGLWRHEACPGGRQEVWLRGRCKMQASSSLLMLLTPVTPRGGRTGGT